MNTALRSGLGVFACVLASAAFAHAQAAPSGPDLAAQRRAEVLRRSAPAFRRCYERELRGAPDLAVRVGAIRVRVATTGRVERVWIELTPERPDLRACLTRALMGMVFDPHEGGPIELSYGFNVDPA